jgi:hypothetical protein
VWVTPNVSSRARVGLRAGDDEDTRGHSGDPGLTLQGPLWHPYTGPRWRTGGRASGRSDNAALLHATHAHAAALAVVRAISHSAACERASGRAGRAGGKVPRRGEAREHRHVGIGRRGAVEAIGEFIAQSPGCRQGTILAPVAAWYYCPAAGLFCLALGHFGSTTRPWGRGGESPSRRD